MPERATRQHQRMKKPPHPLSILRVRKTTGQKPLTLMSSKAILWEVPDLRGREISQLLLNKALCGVTLRHLKCWWDRKSCSRATDQPQARGGKAIPLLPAQQAGDSGRGGPAAVSLVTAAPPGPSGSPGQGTRPAQPFTSLLVREKLIRSLPWGREQCWHFWLQPPRRPVQMDCKNPAKRRFLSCLKSP